jgi:fructose-1,6-bisphosphatase/inositol monophosphatase family enzyme
VDGTRAFISGLPTWGTLIALRYKGEPIIGVIDQPYIRERYLGWPGGATLNGEAIQSRKCATLDKATISTTDPAIFKPHERPAFFTLYERARLTRYGLDCYAYAVVAAGHMDMVIESGLKPYDMMALIPVIRGAGGAATNWEGGNPAGCGRLVAVGDAVLLDEILPVLKGLPVTA